jgi:single-stranded DNA-binding protein
MSATIIAPGRVTKDAEIRKAGDFEIISFSVAVNCFERKEKVTRFYDCSWFKSKRSEQMMNLLRKGAAVTVTGGHSTREHNGKTYQQIEVWNCELNGGGKREDTAPPAAGNGYDEATYGEKPNNPDDLPF